ncbi:MAG TPA: DUF2062 domain-containing protein, partial [bacterium]
MGKLGAMLKDRLIRPIISADASVEAVSWGAAMGVLTALLPTFGIQMYVAFGLWAGWRWAFGKTFNLPACFAASWVMNPLTVVPIYYAYYWTGDTIWDAITVPTPDWTFGEFEDVFIAAISPKGGVWYE